MSFNNNVKHISLLTNLVSLNINVTKIKQVEIINLINLTTLYLFSNSYINDIKHLTNLTFLNAGSSNIKQDSIDKLTNLIHLDIFNNTHITNINHLHNLLSLNISCDSNIDVTSVPTINKFHPKEFIYYMTTLAKKLD